MIQKYKKTLILTTLLTLLPIPVSLLLGREGSAVILLPLSLLAGQWFCVFWTAKDPKNGNQSRKAMNVVLWIIPVMGNLLMVVDYALMKGIPFSVSTVLCLLFGIMFIAIGNYLPKTKQNYTMGIKVSWAYTSEENWNATHRFGGKVWVIGGIVITLAALLPQAAAITVMVVATWVMVLLPIFYSYRYYLRQKREGVELAAPPTMGKRAGKYILIYIAAVLVFVGALMFTGDIHYQYDDTSFTVKASFYDDLTLSYDEIDTLEYRDENVDGLRVWGFGSGRLLMGTFQNKEFGTYTRYTYTHPDSAVVLGVKGRTFVLSGRDAGETRALYDELVKRTKE